MADCALPSPLALLPAESWGAGGCEGRTGGQGLSQRALQPAVTIQHDSTHPGAGWTRGLSGPASRPLNLRHLGYHVGSDSLENGPESEGTAHTHARLAGCVTRAGYITSLFPSL